MKNKQIQFIATSPEELEASILKGVSRMIEELKDSYKPKISPKYMTRKEVCALYHISLMSLWAYTKKGLLRSHSIGNRVLYERQSVLNALVELRPSQSKTGSTNNKKSGHDERF